MRWLDAIVKHARDCLPNECCGMIDSRMTVYRIFNEDESDRSFSMSEATVKAVQGQMEIYGTSLWAIYHSHPLAIAEPGERDVGEMHLYPHAKFIIITPLAFDPTIRMFELTRDKEVREL